jgi:cysteine-rich repeat protein
MKGRFGILAIAVLGLFALARPAAADCVGDCDGNGSVVVNELITGINIALGTADVSDCPSFDVDNSGDVNVAELITAINNALTGCQITAECGNGTKEAGEECDDGNTFGGDGCAENCTLETPRRCTFNSEASATLQTYLFGLSLPLVGSQDLTFGKATSSSGEIPVVIKMDAMRIEHVILPGVACVCVRGGSMAEFGPGNAARGNLGCGEQGLAEVSYFAPIDHNTNDSDPNCALGDLEYDVPCVDSGCGSRSCEGGTLDKDSCTTDSQCKAKHRGVCNSKRGLVFTSGGPRGSMFMRGALSLSLIPDGGACQKNCDPKLPMGPDCLPCTEDDCNQAEADPMPYTTGTAEGEVVDANNRLGPPPDKIAKSSGTACTTNADCSDGEQCWNLETGLLCESGETGCVCQRICSSDPCVTEATGHIVDCNLLASDPNHLMSGSSLAGAISSVDTQNLGDNVVTGIFSCE